MPQSFGGLAGIQEAHVDLENQACDVGSGTPADCLDFGKNVVARNHLTYRHEFPTAETFNRTADCLATC